MEASSRFACAVSSCCELVGVADRLPAFDDSKELPLLNERPNIEIPLLQITLVRAVNG